MAKRKRNNKESKTETKQISQNSGTDVKDAPWSKSKKKRMRKLLSKKQPPHSTKPERPEKKSLPNDKTTILKQTKRQVKHETIEKGGSTTKKINSKSALQQAFLKRLSGSRFRDLNEVRIIITFSQLYIVLLLWLDKSLLSFFFFFK